ncbi:MAG: tripartite tricarboxylate transporter TctB family protein [Salinarimonas sp.]|nr:tripartite tricarboxylate transporter TctB family protein [Salinarimonas sp.]
MPSTRRFLRGDVVIGVILLVLALWYGLEAQNFRPGRAGDPGAGMFPTLLALLLGALALWLIASALISPPADEETDPERRAQQLAIARAGFIRAAIAAVLSIAFVAMFETLGYIISTALYAAAVSLLFRRDNPWITLIAAAGAVGFLHLLFSVFLNARLPMGLLG